jgi:beta-aspartyl-dipeptidase (metallo-type)
MLLLIENGEVYAPEPAGKKSILLAGEKIARIGEVDPRGAEALGLDLEVIDASGCVVIPGLIDPHIHLLGGSGEEGFASRSPDLQLTEITPWGITTVVGVLGVDATTRTLPDLLARVHGLEEEGITAYMYTGAYDVPPPTLTGSVRSDLLFIEKVIGVGEIALSDERAVQPKLRDLARLATDAMIGGRLSGKAGVTHFHVGERPDRLKSLRQLLDDFGMEPEKLYPAHIHRTDELLEEAVDLSRRGSFVDMDAAQENLAEKVREFLEQGGREDRLTLSSDADSNTPANLFLRWRQCVLEEEIPLERALPLVTRNTAEVLHLSAKGRLEPQADADLVVLRKETLDIVHVIAKGKPLIRDGEILVREKFLEESERTLELKGKK